MSKNKKAILFVIIVLGLFGWAGSSFAATYYVSTSGVDSNSGSQLQPWRTIQKAANMVTAGDTVLIAAGTYDERVTFTAPHSGAAQNKIIFRAEPRRSVTMQGFNTTNANYLRIEGFNITNSPDWWLGGGIWLASNGVEIVDNYFYDLVGPGILTSWSNPWPQNVYIADNKIYHSGAGIFISGSNILVENNEIERLFHYPNSTDSDYSRFFGSNIAFRNNYFHNTSESEIGASHVDGFQTFDNNGEYAQHVLIENNVVQNFHQGFMGEAAYYKNSYDITFQNNIFMDSWSWGLAFSNIRDVKVYNNLFSNMFNHGIGVGGEGIVADIKNNIFYNAGSNYWPSGGGSITGGYNLLNREHYPNFKLATDLVNIDPQFSNINNLIGADGLWWTADDGFRPQISSQACAGGEGGTNIGPYSCLIFSDINPPAAPQGLVVQ